MPTSVEELDKVKHFQQLDSEDLQTLAKVIETVKIDAGEILFRVGEPGEALYIVKSGEIELFIKDTAGQKIVLNIAEKDDLFGELAMIDKKPRTATALALTATELYALKRNDLLFVFGKKPEMALNLMATMSGMLRKADELLIKRVSRNANEEMEEKLSPIQRISDWIVWFSGSMQFLFVHAVWFIIWIAINTLPLRIEQFDPFPFGLMTMIVSLESIFLSCFVLISQNRQVEKDRVRSDIEYEVNVKAELEIAHLHEKTDRIYEQMLEKFARLERKLGK